MQRFVVLLVIGFIWCSATAAAVVGTRVREPITVDTSALTGGDDVVSSCDWKSVLLAELVRQTREAGVLVPADSDPKLYPFTLQIQILKLAVLKGKEYESLARMNVFYDGKLVGSIDVENGQTVKAAGACAALQRMALSIGEDAANWTSEIRFPECKGDCTGIHPDQPIAISAEISRANDGPGIDDDLQDVMGECGWRRYLPKNIAERYNRKDPRARIELQEGSLPPGGRRLLVRAQDSRVIGGGNFTGTKWLKLTAELYDGNLLVGNFEASARERGRLSVCWSLEKLSSEAVDDLVSRLEKPSLVPVVK